MDVLEAIRTRRSVRDYSSRALDPPLLDRMRDAIRFAPSACNYQPWRFVFVTDAALRRRIAQAANDQLWMAEAPVTVVGCGVPADAYKQMGGKGNSVEIDIAIALDHLTLAAVSEGLGTCWIGAFAENKIKQLLGVPAHVRVIAMTPLGYPASPGLNTQVDDTNRKRRDEVFSIDRYPAP